MTAATNTKTTVQLDMAFEDETMEEAIGKLEVEYGVKIVIVNRSGPGGGWPVIDATGHSDQLYAMLRSETNGWGMDDDWALETIAGTN